MRYDRGSRVMKLRRLLPMKYRDYMVYTHSGVSGPESAVGEEFQAYWADSEVVQNLFSKESKLRKRFLGFLEHNCIGVFQARGNEWVSYAWMTRMGDPSPCHMPNPPFSNSSWIFHCGTKASYRGRGLYKNSLRLLAMQSQGCRELLIDTEVDNLPSRRAIVSVGFQPYRLVRTWTWSVPRLKSWTFAKWHEGHELPLIDKQAA